MNQRYFLDLGVSISRILQETRAHIIYLSGYYYTSYCYGYGEGAGNRVGETYRDDLKSLQYRRKIADTRKIHRTTTKELRSLHQRMKQFWQDVDGWNREGISGWENKTRQALAGWENATNRRGVREN